MYRKMAQDLYQHSREIFKSIENDIESQYGVSGNVADLHPLKAKEITSLFNNIIGLSVNFPIDRSSHSFSETQRNVITELISLRISDYGQQAKDVLMLAEMDDDNAWAIDVLEPIYRKVVGLFSIAGALNSDFAKGDMEQSELTTFWFSNEEVLISAFLNMPDPVVDLVDRAHGSDLAIFGGILLAVTTYGEVSVFERRRMQNFERNPEFGLADYSDFVPYSLISVLNYERELPKDFWSTYFEAVYPPQTAMLDITFPGTQKWAIEIGRAELFEALAEKYSDFKFEILKLNTPEQKIYEGPELGI